VEFDVIVNYRNPDIGQHISDVFHIDFLDYMNSSVVESEMYHPTQTMKDALQKSTTEVAKLNGHLASLSSISSATGLNVSIPTMRNFKHTIAREAQLEKIDLQFRDYTIFREVLGADVEMALSLKAFFDHRGDGQRIADIQGMTPELADRIRQHFIVEPDADESTPGDAN